MFTHFLVPIVLLGLLVQCAEINFSLVIFCGMDGTLYALDSETGELRWSSFLPNFSEYIKENNSQIKIGPTEKDKYSFIKKNTENNFPAFFPGFDGSLYLPISTNEKDEKNEEHVNIHIQKLGITTNDIVSSSPFIDKDGFVYLGSKRSEVFKIDGATGKVLDVFSFTGNFQASDWTRPEESNVLFISREFTSIKSSSQINDFSWNITMPAYRPLSTSSTSSSPVRVALGTRNTVCRTDETGNYVIWTARLPAPAMSAIYFSNCAQCWRAKSFNAFIDAPYEQIIANLEPNFFSNADELKSKDSLSLANATSVYVGSILGVPYVVPTQPAPKQILPPALQITMDFSEDSSALVVHKERLKNFDEIGTFPIEQKKCDNEQCGLVKYFEPMKNTSLQNLTTPIQPVEYQKDNLVLMLSIFFVTTVFVIGGIVLGGFTLFYKKTENIVKENIATLKGDVLTIGHLKVFTNEIIGYGNSGTTVYKGDLDNRSVAVKRLLKHNTTVANSEISLLIEADEHPNVVRYYASETDSQFIYLALTLCRESLTHWVESHMTEVESENSFTQERIGMMKDLLCGLQHLHKLRIIHRDIKPDNILIDNKGVVRITDMGIAKTMEGTHLSCTNVSAGSFGWQSPEILTITSENGTLPSKANDTTNKNHSRSSRSGNLYGRITPSVDMFAAGCVLYYIITGVHPFGDRLEREINILNGKHFMYNDVKIEDLMKVYNETIKQNIERRSLKLQEKNMQRTNSSESHSNIVIVRKVKPSDTSLLYGENINWTFVHLISTLVVPDPKLRSTASESLEHPFFWSAQKFIKFFTALSDRMEILPRDDVAVCELEGDNFPNFSEPTIDSIMTKRLSNEELIPYFAGQENIQWQMRACNHLKADLAIPIRRRYNFNSWRDLLRMIRNKTSHYYDLSENIRNSLGSLPDGVFNYFNTRYPTLCMRSYLVALRHFSKEKEFTDFFPH